MPQVNIFISTVSNEFGNCRNILRQYLTQSNISVKIQEDFGPSGVQTINKIDSYIINCDTVVHLVGEQAGHPINVSSRDWLQTHYPTLADKFPALREVLDGTVTASYTQWEAYLAVMHGKMLFVAQPTTEAPRDNAAVESSVPVQDQEQHLKRLRELGVYPEIQFYNTDNLIAKLAPSLIPLLQKATSPVQVHNLPYNSLGSLFKGREAVLDGLREKFIADTSPFCKALYGLGGIGKTRLAVEYAWRYQQEYSTLLFVQADTPSSLEANLAALCGPLMLNLPEQNAQDQNVRVRAVLDWLARYPGWLLVLDNVDLPEAAEAAEKWLPQLGGGHVLLTTRLSQWNPQVECFELGVLSEDAAAAFLLERTTGRQATSTDDSDAIALAHALGYLALALEQAGAYIATRPLTLAAYHKRWSTNEKAVREWVDKRLMNYPTSVAVTWLISFEQLNPNARMLLNCMAWLSPAPIPLTLLASSAASKFVPDTEEALVELTRYSLATFTGDKKSFSIHRLVQEVTRALLADKEPLVAFMTMLTWLSVSFLIDDMNTERVLEPQDVRNWPTLVPLMPHTLALADHAHSFGNPHPTAQLLNNLGVLLFTKAQLIEAESLFRRSLQIDEHTYGINHPKTTHILNNLSNLLRQDNRLVEAEELMRHALEIDEAYYGPDHIEVAINLNNLAGLLCATNRKSEGEQLYRRTLKISEHYYGPNHPRVATLLNNLAEVLRTTNQLAEAEPLYRRSLQIMEQHYGPEHPEVGSRYDNLGKLLETDNRLDEAELYFRQALRIVEQSYGTEHPAVARCLNNLAHLLQNTSRQKEAEPMYQRALNILEKSYGPSHPEVAYILANLSLLMQDTSRWDEAESLLHRALQINESSYGPNHPQVGVCLCNLGALLQSIGRLADAETLLRRALVIEEKSYGSNYPGVAVILNNLGSLLRDRGKLKEAEVILRQALEINKKSRSLDHPEVATCSGNLAGVLQRLGQYVEAETLFREALRINKLSYGADHQTVATSLYNLANLLKVTNRWAEAVPLLRRAIAILKDFHQRTGFAHPDFRTIIRGLSS